jgi:ribosome biogenesis GTPase
LADGTLSADRWQSFLKLQGELAHEHRKADPRARAESRKAWISRNKAAKARMKAKREPDG